MEMRITPKIQVGEACDNVKNLLMERILKLLWKTDTGIFGNVRVEKAVRDAFLYNAVCKVDDVISCGKNDERAYICLEFSVSDKVYTIRFKTLVLEGRKLLERILTTSTLFELAEEPGLLDNDLRELIKSIKEDIKADDEEERSSTDSCSNFNPQIDQSKMIEGLFSNIIREISSQFNGNFKLSIKGGVSVDLGIKVNGYNEIDGTKEEIDLDTGVKCDVKDLDLEISVNANSKAELK